MTDRTRNTRPHDDATVGKPSPSSDPFADYTVDELQAALAWHRGDRTGEPPAPILAFIDYRLIAQEHLTPEEALAVATLTDLELRFEILDRAYGRAVTR
jgi:hypothetical protein